VENEVIKVKGGYWGSRRRREKGEEKRIRRRNRG
jgi:hypothetical protein